MDIYNYIKFSVQEGDHRNN